MNDHYIKPIFEPESVAVIGASERTDSVGRQVLQNILQGGFQGKIYPVNPKHKQVQGLTCYRSLTAIDHQVDLVVVAIPSKLVPKIIRECGQNQVRAIIVISAGFAEVGKQGEALQNEIVDLAKTYHIPLMGPNCLGVIRPARGLNATFAKSQAKRGHVALVAQSGAFCTALLDWADSEGFGFSAVASLGATSDIGFGDVLEFLAGDPETHSIILYVEGITHARSFLSGLRVAARLKPVVLVKSGRNETGIRAAVSHTATLMGKDAVFDAAIERAGAVRVTTVNQLFAATKILAKRVGVEGCRLGILTNGGGPGVMAADHCADIPLPLAELSADSIKKLNSILPAHWSHSNPVDILSDADAERYHDCTRIMLQDEQVDGLLILLTPQGMTNPTTCAEAVIRAAESAKKPILACWMGQTLIAEGRKLLNAAGIPSFRSPEAGVDAFGYLAKYHRNQKALLQSPSPLSHNHTPDVEGARLIIENAIDQGRRSLSNTESKAILHAFHIPSSPSFNVNSAAEALVAAENLGLPVAMKINSPNLTHKSDVGGVRLNIADAKSVRTIHNEMIEHISTERPEAIIEGVTIEPMLNRPNAREIMIGIVQDPVFGPVISFGSGGTAVEIIADSAVALPPLNEYLSKRLIEDTRAAKFLKRFRSLPGANIGSIIEVLQRVSEISCELPEIEELDINPLLVDEQGLIAVDARIVIRPHLSGSRRYDHMAIHPYPTELESTWQLSDGTDVSIRPIRPEDARIEQTFVKTLSAEAKYLRFMQSLDELTPQMLARMTQIDYDQEMALIAVLDDHSDHAKIISVARYAMNPDHHSCEFAIIVADDFQHKGIGRHMIKKLIHIASERGIEVMEAEVLSRNYKMLDLVEKLGFRKIHNPDDQQVVHIRRHLQ